MLSTVKIWLWLTCRLDPGPAWAALHHFGGPEQIYFADRSEYQHVPGLTEAQRRRLDDKDLQEVEDLLARCDRTGIRILTWQDADYPELLRIIETPPPLLYLRGTLPRLEDRLSIAMAGTRKASPYGLMKAREIAYGLTAAGALVVTGIVSGCDQAAVEGALLAGGGPICVTAGGVDVPYYGSQQHDSLLKDIAAKGTLISASPPGTPHLGERFSLRNRILTGLARGTLCVEAPARSGTLQVAHLAADQGRDVYALLSNADSSSAAGTSALLAAGEAIPVRNAGDVLSHYPIFIPMESDPLPPPEDPAAIPPESEMDSSPAIPASEQEKRPIWKLSEHKSELTDDEREILPLLCQPQIPDYIVQTARIPARRVSSALTVLTIRGLVEELPGGRFRACVLLE